MSPLLLRRLVAAFAHLFEQVALSGTLGLAAPAEHRLDLVTPRHLILQIKRPREGALCAVM